jgi:hypothetical protein
MPARIPALLSAVATNFLSRLLGRKTRTGRPDFSVGGVAVEDFSDLAMESREDFRRLRAGGEAVCRAVGRGFFFISAENSASDLEGTIILLARRATFPDAGRSRS